MGTNRWCWQLNWFLMRFSKDIITNCFGVRTFSKTLEKEGRHVFELTEETDLREKMQGVILVVPIKRRAGFAYAEGISFKVWLC